MTKFGGSRMVIFEKNVDSQLNYDDVAPDASAMIESMRAHGYG